MALPGKPANPGLGFPKIEWEEEEQFTRPMGLHERPLQARIENQMALVAAHYSRVAKTIDDFWGHHQCVPYIESLILNGYKDGEKRMGFKTEVLTALITLIELHKEAFGD